MKTLRPLLIETQEAFKWDILLVQEFAYLKTVPEYDDFLIFQHKPEGTRPLGIIVHSRLRNFVTSDLIS